MDKELILEALRKGEIDLRGQFLMGSNYTFLVGLNYQEQEKAAVYKPVRGEQPLWDFPEGTLGKREVAAYYVSELLAWELVPPTIFRRRSTPLGSGSLQIFIEHDPNDHYFSFSDADKQRLRPVVAFDLLINNADRKGSHILRDGQDHFWLIDHGICFHTEDKLRTVIWDFAGESIPSAILDDLNRLLGLLPDDSNKIVLALRKMLRPAEIAAIARRAHRMLDSGRFPQPGKHVRAFPWPPV
jgi:uncharacterized repeat protein (TIGR03843 family)